MARLVQVVPGVHVVDAYAHSAILTDQRLVLVDATSEADAAPIFDALRRLHVEPRDLTSILVTHTHPDHTMGLATLRERTGAKVAAHQEEVPFIEKSRVYEGPPGPRSHRHQGVPVDAVLVDGQTHEGLEVLHTPGHTPGHICLYDRERRVLIAGDALNTDPGSGPVSAEAGVGEMGDNVTWDRAKTRASIRRLAELEFEALVVGHGDPVVSGAAERVRALARSF